MFENLQKLLTVRHDPCRKFDADQKLINILAIFQKLPTLSCCYGVKGLKSFCAPWQLKLQNKKRSGGKKLGCGANDLPRIYKQFCVKQ